MKYYLVFISLKEPDQMMRFETYNTKERAEEGRYIYRRILGGRNWTIDRRPGLDTLGNLGMCVMSERAWTVKQEQIAHEKEGA